MRSTRADASGRFSIPIRAWGQVRLGARWRKPKGPWGVTEVVLHREGESEIQLQEVREVPHDRKLLIHGLDAWSQKEILCFYLRDDHDDLHVLAQDPGGTLTLPVLPGRSEVLEIRTADGRLLKRCLLGFEELERGIHLPPPLRLRVRVRGKQGNRPIPGAQIHRLGPKDARPRQALAVTNAQGEALFWYPRPLRSWGGRGRELLFCVLAAHCEPVYFGWNTRIPGAEARIDQKTVLDPVLVKDLHLTRAPLHHGDLLGGSPADRRQLRLFLRSRLSVRRHESRHLPTLPVRTSDRRIALPIPIGGHWQGHLELLLTPALLGRLGRTHRAWTGLPADLRRIPFADLESGKQIPDLDLGRLALWRILLPPSAGGRDPAPVMLRLDKGLREPQVPMRIVLDHPHRWQRTILGARPPLLLLRGAEYCRLEPKAKAKADRTPGRVLQDEVTWKLLPSISLHIAGPKGLSLGGLKFRIREKHVPQDRLLARLLKIQKRELPMRQTKPGQWVLYYLPELHQTLDRAQLEIQGEAGKKSLLWWHALSDLLEAESPRKLRLDPETANQRRAVFRRKPPQEAMKRVLR